MGTGSTAVATAGCNNNWSTWGVGSRTQWDVTKTFYLGVEVLYRICIAHSRSTTWSLLATPSAAPLLLDAG